MRHKKIILKWASASAKLAFRLLAVSAEMALRSNFGVRYIGTLLAGYLLFAFYTLIVQASNQGRLLGLYFVWVTICFVGHIIKILLPQSRLVHSHSPGTPWRLWQNLTARQWLIELVFEPGLLFLV